MTPARMVEVLSAAMTSTRVWSLEEVEALLADPAVFSVSTVHGFALGRVAADEAELLTIAVAPEAQRTGVAFQLLGHFEETARARGATRAFLEVADDNQAALALYKKGRWNTVGRRADYYVSADALVLSKPL